MSILVNFLNLVEKLDNKREAYLEAQERERAEYIKKHGHPPYSDNWCSTIEIQNRIELEFRRKMKAIMARAKQMGYVLKWIQIIMIMMCVFIKLRKNG